MDKKVLGILAHVDAGKTTLSEAMLYVGGTIKSCGRVDNRNTVLDSDVCERERGITILSKTARIKTDDSEIILIDTPGHVDFSPETERTLAVLDCVILLVSTTDKVTAHTKTLWKLIRRHNIPTIIFVNKMDMPNADKDEILSNLASELSKNVIAISPTKGFVDADANVSAKGAVDAATGNPAEVFEKPEKMFEELSMASDRLCEAYLEKGYLSAKEIAEGFNCCDYYPVMFGSALRVDGVDKLLRVIQMLAKGRPQSNEFGAAVYKISRDKAGNKLAHMKITGQSLAVKSMLGADKVSEIRLYSGDKYESVREAFAGDIVAIPGLSDCYIGKCYGSAQNVGENALSPVMTYAVKYPTDVDSTQMLRMLREIEEEDPTLNVTYVEQTREIMVSLMGEVSADILKRRVADRFNVAITFTNGKITYKETIEDIVEGVGHFEPLRHYAEVHVRIEPGECGSGIVIENEADSDELSTNWQRLILTHLKEKKHKGVLLGAPITDVVITLVSGKAHIKHTEGGDFRQATYRAVRQGLMQATSHLLEPWYQYEMYVPTEFVGHAMTDLDRMHGTTYVEGESNGVTTLTGLVPVSEANGYVSDLIAYTKGKGAISFRPAGYLPCHNEDEIIENSTYDPEADLANPPGSVFCSHGAGTVIPWYEVFDYMHVPLKCDTADGEYSGDESITNMAKARQHCDSNTLWATTEEIDAIINSISHANAKARHNAYKGMSARHIESRRIPTHKEVHETVYKGTVTKDKYMLVDAYNVIFAWTNLRELAKESLDGAAGRLIDILCNYQGFTGVNLIAVFDAYKVKGHGREEMDYGNVKVVYTKTAETADRYIERYAHENASKFDITVVTSDGIEQVIIRGKGCNLISSREFEEEVRRVGCTTD